MTARLDLPRLAATAALTLALLGLAGPAHAGSLMIDFNADPFPTAGVPDNFNDAGSAQTYTAPGVFTISGGVLLANPGFLPALAAAGSVPNVYGTTDIADPSLSPTITIDLAPGQGVTTFTGLLLNGQNLVASGMTENYIITAYSGATAVDTRSLYLSTDLTSLDSTAVFSVASAAANPITRVTITTPNAAADGVDFFVATPAPEPSTLVGAGLAAGLAGVHALRRRRGVMTS